MDSYLIKKIKNRRAAAGGGGGASSFITLPLLYNKSDDKIYMSELDGSSETEVFDYGANTSLSGNAYDLKYIDSIDLMLVSISGAADGCFFLDCSGSSPVLTQETVFDWIAGLDYDEDTGKVYGVDATNSKVVVWNDINSSTRADEWTGLAISPRRPVIFENDAPSGRKGWLCQNGDIYHWTLGNSADNASYATDNAVLCDGWTTGQYGQAVNILLQNAPGNVIFVRKVGPTTSSATSQSVGASSIWTGRLCAANSRAYVRHTHTTEPLKSWQLNNLANDATAPTFSDEVTHQANTSHMGWSFAIVDRLMV